MTSWKSCLFIERGQFCGTFLLSSDPSCSVSGVPLSSSRDMSRNSQIWFRDAFLLCFMSFFVMCCKYDILRSVIKVNVTWYSTAIVLKLWFADHWWSLVIGPRSGLFNLLSSRTNLHLSYNPAGRSHCRLQNHHEHIKHHHRGMGGSPGDVREVPVTYVKQRKGCRMTRDVGEAAEGLENELWRRWSGGRVGEWDLT